MLAPTDLLPSLLFAAAIAFVMAAVLTPLVARAAFLRGWIDRPDGGRKLHTSPIPAVGGIAVLVGFACAGLYTRYVGCGVVGDAESICSTWLPLIIAAILVSAIGLVDDARGVRPVAKLAVQAAAGLFLYWNGFQIVRVSNPLSGAIELGVLSIPVTLLWFVGMSNAFNLIDGLDGLAAGLALVSTLGLLAAAAINGRWETVLIAAGLAGALLGFLPYNFSPARVFLGDCGALMVGFVLAAIAVKSSIKASAALAVAVPLLALALPILDVALAIVRRFVRRRPVFEGDRDHIHHRLLEKGLTPRRAVVTLYGCAAFFVAMGLAVAAGPKTVTWAVGAVVLLAIWIGVRALGYWEVTEIQKSLLSRAMASFRPSGDAALRGASQEMERLPSFERGWERLCETAWEVGLTELRLVPTRGWRQALPPRSSAPLFRPLASTQNLSISAWIIRVEVRGELVAEVVARRPLGPLDFDPTLFAQMVQSLVRRHLTEAKPATHKGRPALAR